MRKTINRRIILLLVFILTITSLGITSVFAATTAELPAPTGVKAASAGSDSVTISWNAVSGAKGYNVFRAESATGAFTQIKSTSNQKHTDSRLTYGKTYYYKVQAYARASSELKYGAFSAPIAAVPGAATQPTTPTTAATTTPTTTSTTGTSTTSPTTAATTSPTTAVTTSTAAPTTVATTTFAPTTTTAAPTTVATTTFASPTTTTAASTTVATTTKATTTTATTTAATTNATTVATATTAATTTAAVTSSVSVKTYGALGNGVANDTAAIQRALNSRAPVISIPDGTYMVDAVTGLKPLSNQTILLGANATLKAIPNASSYYNVIRLEAVSNVEVNGGRIVGDRSAHLGTTGEHGMGITIGKNTVNIRIRNITIRDCWGDGIYIGSDATGIASSILIENIVADNNRRQGLSITNAEYVTVRNSIFKNTNGIAPQAGLDIEPNSGCRVNNVTVTGCQFTNNAGYGMVVNGAKGLYVRTVSIDSNWFSGNVLGISNTANATDISLTIPAGTTRINDTEYAQCYGLDKLTIPNTVTTIGSNAFRACYDLTSVTIPGSVTSIGIEAFKYCTKLASIRIPASVTSIGNLAFYGCSSLKTAYFYGNAPTTTNYLFLNTAADFKVYYIAGKTGFTSPTWRGYPSATFVP